MAIPVSGNVKCSVNISEAIVSELSTGSLAGSLGYNLSFANGTGANAINQAWTWSDTLAVSTPVTHDLTGLTDGLGRAISFTKIRAIFLKNNGTADLIVGGATAPVPLFSDASDKLPVRPGGVFIFIAPGAAGIAVTATTADGLKLDPGATACPYELVILGEA